MSQALAAQISLPPSPLSQRKNSSQVPFEVLDAHQSETSLNTVHRTRRRNISLTSASSYSSRGSGELRVRNANVPNQSASDSNLYLNESLEGHPYQCRSSKQASHKSSWGTDIPVPRQPSDPSTFLLEAGHLENIDLNVKSERVKHGSSSAHTYSFNADPYLSLHVAQEMVARSFQDQENVRPSAKETETAAPTTNGLRRWMSTLRPKPSKSIETLKVRRERWSLDDFEERPLPRISLSQRGTTNSHRRASSSSSSGVVEAMKSAKLGLGSLTGAHSSRRKKSILRSSDVSSRVTRSGNRTSMDSGHGSISHIDEAACTRGIQRRRTLEELVSSEESYISDLKVLVNVIPRHVSV